MRDDRTDEQIIAVYKTGNDLALKILVERYSSHIYNFLAQLTDKTNAPDLTQEVFIKVWRKIKSFDAEKASFRTWLFTIAKNTATDYLRKKRPLSFTDVEMFEHDKDPIPFQEKIPDEVPLPPEALQKIQDAAHLQKILSELRPIYREVLILRYQEDMTFEEIGRILEISPNTAKSHHRRAILALRQKVDRAS